MLTFHFQVKPRLLAYSFIKNTPASRFVSGEYDPEIVKFQNAAWFKDRAINDFIRFGLQDEFFVSDKSVEELSKNSDTFLREMIDDQTFAPLLSQTLDSLTLVREEWEANSRKSSDIINRITGLEINVDLPVYLTHPKIKQGHAGRDCIFWAYRLDWPNYNTIYLWHEYLHIAIPGGDLEHAVIQLIADNELRILLNGGSYPPFEGHKYLNTLMALLLPQWRRFMQNAEHKDIKSFIAKMAEVPAIQKELKSCAKNRQSSD